MSKLPATNATGSRPRAQRRPRADSEATRRAILAATLRILRDRGLASLTHRAVAQEAGVSLALTSYHFASKENLIAEALELAMTDTTARLDETATALLAGDRPVTPAVVAERLCDLTMSRLGDDELAVVSVIELSLAASRRPALQRTTAEWNHTYESIVVELLDRAGIVGPREAAALVVATLEGLVFLQLAEANPDFEHAVLRPALSRLLASLAAGG